MSIRDPFDLSAKVRRSADDAEKRELARRTARKDLAALMADGSGRRFMRWLLDSLGWRSPCWDSNAVVASRRSSRSDFAKELVDELEVVCPDAVVLMHKERIDEERIADGSRNDQPS